MKQWYALYVLLCSYGNVFCISGSLWWESAISEFPSQSFSILHVSCILAGRVLNIHVAPVKVKDASRGLDPDLTYWSALEKYGVQYLHMARIFYEKGVPQKLKIGKQTQWRHNGCDGVSNHQPHHCLRCEKYRYSQLSFIQYMGLYVTIPTVKSLI